MKPSRGAHAVTYGMALVILLAVQPEAMGPAHLGPLGLLGLAGSFGVGAVLAAGLALVASVACVVRGWKIPGAAGALVFSVGIAIWLATGWLAWVVQRAATET